MSGVLRLGNATHWRTRIWDGLLTTGRASVQEVIEAFVLGVEPGVAAVEGVCGVPGCRFRVAGSGFQVQCYGLSLASVFICGCIEDG